MSKPILVVPQRKLEVVDGKLVGANYKLTERIGLLSILTISVNDVKLDSLKFLRISFIEAMLISNFKKFLDKLS